MGLLGRKFIALESSYLESYRKGYRNKEQIVDAGFFFSKEGGGGRIVEFVKNSYFCEK